MLNHIAIMGRLVRDPELRRTSSGVAVCTITLAVDRDFKGQNGEKETDYIDVVTWKGTAEFTAKYFAKGRMAAAVGRLQIREYTDKSGAKRKAAEIVADHVYFAGDKPDAGSSTYAPPAYVPQSADGFAELPDDGDLPF